ncbi:Aminomethyltransferase [Limtongia smithiae]|uniref:Aminomethyltransferase n=1 Tax=Limtongia smithiae TaxID=1125753 RepID=UPI0034CFB9E7
MNSRLGNCRTSIVRAESWAYTSFALRGLTMAVPSLSVRHMATAPKAELHKTALYDLHVAHGATFVPYAGYSMPVVYDGQTHLESHKWVRAHAGLFDVSHMVQHVFTGRHATKFLESLTPSSLQELAPYRSTLSTFLNPAGGIVDDTMITKHNDERYYVVTNAGCREKDLAYLASELTYFADGGVQHEVLDGWGILALQGPKAAEVLQRLTEEKLQELKFGGARVVQFVDGGEYHVARGGYTGEDGFEISVPPAATLGMAEHILSASREVVRLAGLAARDSLRLEAGMCLYGHDLDETTTPIEAGLGWIIGARRKEQGGFNGYERVKEQLDKGTTRRRVGFVVSGPPAREGAKVYAKDGDAPIGTITSGSPSPTLGVNIGMGYVQKGFWKKETPVEVEVRGRRHAGAVARMPFVAPRYYR